MTEKHHLFSPELAAAICERVAKGETIGHICRDASMPDRTSIWRWSVSNPEFANQLDRAIELRADHWAEETLAIADEGIQTDRDRLRVDTRKWLAQKLYRKRYGDHQELEVKGELTNQQPILNVFIDGNKSALVPETGDSVTDKSE